MADTTATYSAELGALTTAYQSAVSAALAGPALDLRNRDTVDVIDQTLDVLAAQCLKVDQAGEVTKTAEVEIGAQIEAIDCVLDNAKALEAAKAGSNAKLKVAAQALAKAGQALASGLGKLETNISAKIVEGYSNPDAKSHGAQVLFDNAVHRYRQSVDAILSDAGKPFRTAEATKDLDKSIAELSALLADMDANPIDVSEAQTMGLQAQQLVGSIQSAFSAVEAADLAYIRSPKVATLDQPKLKPYLKVIAELDKGFSQELSFLFGDTTVDPGEPTELDAAVDAAAQSNVPNIPMPDTAQS